MFTRHMNVAAENKKKTYLLNMWYTTYFVPLYCVYCMLCIFYNHVILVIPPDMFWCYSDEHLRWGRSMATVHGESKFKQVKIRFQEKSGKCKYCWSGHNVPVETAALFWVYWLARPAVTKTETRKQMWFKSKWQNVSMNKHCCTS